MPMHCTVTELLKLEICVKYISLRRLYFYIFITIRNKNENIQVSRIESCGIGDMKLLFEIIYSDPGIL